MAADTGLSVIGYKIYSARADFVLQCNRRRDQSEAWPLVCSVVISQKLSKTDP